MRLPKASDTVNDIQREVEYRVKNSTWVDIEVGDIILNKLIYAKKQIDLYLKSYRNITIMKEHFRGVRVFFIFNFSAHLSSIFISLLHIRLIL